MRVAVGTENPRESLFELLAGAEINFADDAEASGVSLRSDD
jgi:hypothetical protein